MSFRVVKPRRTPYKNASWSILTLDKFLFFNYNGVSASIGRRWKDLYKDQYGPFGRFVVSKNVMKVALFIVKKPSTQGF